MQFFARSTPRVNNASSSSDNEHRKKYFFLHCLALSYCIIAQRTRSDIHPSRAKRRENQTHTPIWQFVRRELVRKDAEKIFH
jgi:hypothetical protein